MKELSQVKESDVKLSTACGQVDIAGGLHALDARMNLPMWLSNVNRWVLWRSEVGKKIPCSVDTGRRIDVVKQGIAWTLRQALDGRMDHGTTGVGIVLNGDGLVCVDLDDCLTECGELKPGVQDVLMKLNGGYIEVSPSGRGLHVFGFSDVKEHTGVQTELDGLKVEMYSQRRYITVTGHTLNGFDCTSASDGCMPGYKSLLEVLSANRSTNNPDTTELQLTQEIQEIQEIQEKQARVGASFLEIKHIPMSCVVERPGQRNRKCFELARWIKFVKPDATLSERRSFVKQWHELFIDQMDTKEFSDTWVDFISCWPKVKHPYGLALYQIVQNLPELPDAMQDHQLGALGETLLRICVGLARRTPDGRFFLSGHIVAEYLGCSAQWTYQLIGAAVQTELLVLEFKGFRGKASEYKLGAQAI